ncbi:hypothetical protein PPL_01271 [Heterostelium album PN500]|uniref:F-box domain-containing protein n=1 Tax=Heterostelium pallidum (strain ATCC 26659 / Pp 5 / PN500) TaxID=670386 RepID=D3AYL1_HETP5|nr:hypothetical protein PPL_01271 [Heterostelium album PN500]EFA86038.1 hypothetical protein PPL_01271 [Heterostelium album PN500]|eukprot:XP_020438144.1 hypothetical protein PPL_01271 [Heterostelium album PN500]
MKFVKHSFRFGGDEIELPSSIIFKVFEYVFNNEMPSKYYVTLSLVCKLWRQYAFLSVQTIRLVPKRLQHLLMPYKPVALDTALSTISNMLINSRTITVLDLSNSEIDITRTSIIGVGIAHSESVKHLNLHCTALDDKAAKELADALRDNKTIQTIDLSHNHIGAEGALAIAQSLESSKTITTIDLSKNQIGNQGALSIAKVFGKSRVKVNLASNQIGSDCIIAIAKARKSTKTSFLYKSGLKLTTMDGRCTLTASVET